MNPSVTTEKRVPVTVLTGFLGSGKTTLLNYILTQNHGKRIAVIENEFGEIGIDNELVINADEEIFEMNNGCICCTVRGDLIRILGNLMKRRDKFDYIMIETTGLADPAPVAQTFFVDEEMKTKLSLDGIVAVIDAHHVQMQLERSPESIGQIAFADVILLNKTDLVTLSELDKLETRIREINSMAKVHRTKNAVVEMDQILNVGGFDLDRALSIKPTFLKPEYPFEWGGTYQLEPGDYNLVLEEGPDPTMSLAVIPIQNEDPEVDAEAAVRVYAENKKGIEPDEFISPGPVHYDLKLAETGKKNFVLKIARRGLYHFYTQHLPEEFSMTLLRMGDPIQPIRSINFNPEHEHDDSVSSVGISFEGEIQPEKVNEWMGKLLREKGTDIFRMKGILSIQGQEERFVFQGVHMLFDGKSERPWKPGENRTNQLVFIGKNLNRDELTRGFKSCLA